MSEHNEVIVLHALRCMGAVSLERLPAATHLTSDEVESILIDLAVDGLVIRTPPPFGGWCLTEAGRAEDARRIAAELAAARAESAIDEVFDEFMILNPKALELCTDWQLRTLGGKRVLNNHDDPRYDDAVLRRLSMLNTQIQPLCEDLTAALARFRPYGVRLETARDRALAGELSAVTDSLDSFHSVWFQLHEDLLATLGREREH